MNHSENKVASDKQDCADKKDLSKPSSNMWFKAGGPNGCDYPRETDDKLIYASPDYMYLEGGIFLPGRFHKKT